MAISGIFEYQKCVDPSALDRLGHVNNVEYIRWMQEAAIAHVTSLGWSTERHLENGIVWVAHTHAIQYHRPAFESDVINIRTWVENFRKVRSLRKYKIYRESDEELLATAETDWALLRVDDFRPTRIPQQLIDLFQDSRHE